MSFPISPGVYWQEQDFSITSRFISPSIAAIVGAFERGPTSPTLITDQTNYSNKYGKAAIAYGYTGFSGFYFLDVGNQLWVRRVVNSNARYALGFFSNDYDHESAKAVQTSWNSVNAGDTNPYDGEQRQVQEIAYNDNFVTSNSISVTVNGGSPATVVFTNSHANTIQLLAAAIQTKVDAIASGGKVFVPDFTGFSDRVIRVVSPINTTITLSSISVTGGATQATGIIRDTDILFWVYSENPGAWANKLFVKLSDIDAGYTQRLKMTFSAALVPSNVVNGTINGFAITPVTYSGNSDDTLDAVAASIESCINSNIKTGAIAGVTVVSGGTSNDREIIIIAPDATVNLTFAGFAVTAGASQATITVLETQKQILPNSRFKFSVYEYPNINVPQESWTVSLKDSDIDGYGRQNNVEYVVNSGPSKSSFVRVVLNTMLAEADRLVLNTITSTTNYLTGGDDGASVTANDVITGWNDFADPESITVRLLINGGWSVPSVHQKMANLAETRHDCFAILDMPSEYQTAQDAVAYRTQQMNIDSNFAAVYTPDVMVNDENTGQQLYVPPSGLVAARYAYTDKNFAEWGAPAGLNRGGIKRAMQLRVAYNEGDRDYLSTNQINPIIKKNTGFVIWGEYTLQVAMSDLSSVGVRRMLITVETTLTNTVAYSVFEPNDEPTRNAIRSNCEDFLSLIKQGRGLIDYLVVCDNNNNKPPTIEARQVNVWVFMKPTLAALYIRVTGVLTKQGGSFTEDQLRLSNLGA